MSYEPLNAQTNARAEGQRLDMGLQAYMRSVFNTMGMGLVVTGLVAFAVANVPSLAQLIFGTPLKWVAIFSPLAIILFGFTPSRIARMKSSDAKTLFMVLAAVMGLSMASIFLVFSGASIAKVFFITATTFAATSLWGYTTKKDLTAMGSFMMMGIIGICLASVVNIFLHSSSLQWVISVLGVVAFTGMTAWDVQRLKETYSYGRYGADDAMDKVAVMGALGLYLNFINLFQLLMNLMGDRR